MNKNRSKNQRSSKGKQQKKSKTEKTYHDVKRECREKVDGFFFFLKGSWRVERVKYQEESEPLQL